jgi:hypothetical protein
VVAAETMSLTVGLYLGCMSEHVIQNPVPTPEQMANLLGVSPARVATLRNIMRSESKPVPSYPGVKPRKAATNEAASTLSAPLRQFKMRKKTSSGAKAAAR